MATRLNDVTLAGPTVKVRCLVESLSLGHERYASKGDVFEMESRCVADAIALGHVERVEE